MAQDIRDAPYLHHKDILALNFIKDPPRYHYRRHYREGLRSHIMEVLSLQAVENETKGILVDGLRWYPRAEPLKMLRIFRTRFNSLEDAEEELRRVKIVEAYLAHEHMARSEEFLVDYSRHEKQEILLCGLQEYVKGEILDPWSLLDGNHLVSLLSDMGLEHVGDSAGKTDSWRRSVREKAERFVGKLKEMIVETNHVPDLAGIGNLLLTRSADIKLVDINNISKVSFDPIISVDDRGYPVCDKSIQAIWLLEKKLLGRCSQESDPVYQTFLDPERMKDVKALEEAFHLSIKRGKIQVGPS